LGKELLGSSNKHYFASRTRSKDAYSTITTDDIPTLAECPLRLGWHIKKDRHGILVMINPNLHEIKYEGCLHKLIQEDPDLADKAIVTKVYRCSAYARLITDRGRSGQVYVGFKASNTTPVDTLPTVISAAGVDQSWQTSSQSGTWTTGMFHSTPSYTPLATLRQITPKAPAVGYRDDMEMPDDEEMETYRLPWGELDDKGDEIDPNDLAAYLGA